MSNMSNMMKMKKIEMRINEISKCMVDSFGQLEIYNEPVYYQESQEEEYA